MKKRTSRVSRRVVSLLMSLVLTLTLVTPAAFATEVAGGSGTTIVEGDTNPADANPSGDNEGKDDENKDTEHGGDEQPTNPGDEDKNPGEGEDDVNASSNEADTQEGEGTDTPVVAQRTVTVERYRTDAAYEVKIVVGVEEDGTTEKLDTTYTINADTKTVTLKLTTADYAGEPIYIKTALDDVLVTEGENQTPALTKDTPTLEYTLPNEGDVTLYYGTQEDFVSAWYGDGTATGYYIRTAEELANFAQLVNSENDFSGKTITLGKNIVLDGSDWTPIGTKDNPFKGTFNGRNGSTYYTISGLNGDLFGVVNGIIQYVTIDGGKGRLVGELESGTVQYCMSTAEVTGSTGGLVGKNSGTVNRCYYYHAGSKNTPAVGGSSDKVTKCFYLADTSTFGAKSSDNGARTAEEFQLGRVAYELGGSSYVWVYDTTNKAEKMPQLGRSSGTMAVANELKLTKPDNQPEGVVVTLGNDSDKKTLTDAAGNQYYYAASGYPEGVSDVPVTFTAPTGYQIVFAPAATQVGGKDYHYEFTQELQSRVDALPDALSTEDAEEVAFLLERLKMSREFDGYDRYMEKLTAAQEKIDALYAEIESLNADIAAEILPMTDAGLKEKPIVDGIVKRYRTLSEHDRELVESWDAVLAVKAQTDAAQRTLLLCIGGAAVVMIGGSILVRRRRESK